MAFSHLTTCALRALKSLLTPGIPKFCLLSALLSFVVLVALLGGSSWLLHDIITAHMPPDLQWLLGWIEGIGAVLLAGALFPLLLPLVIGLFTDQIAEAIEKQEYPHLPLPQPAPFLENIRYEMGFAIKAMLLNIFCLPVYLVPGINAVWFYLLNGYLVGKQLLMMVGARYASRANVAQMLLKNRLSVLIGGILVILCATVPFLNLVAPIWSVAFMVHLFQTLSTRKPLYNV